MGHPLYLVLKNPGHYKLLSKLTDSIEVGEVPLIILNFGFLWPGLKIGILLDN